MNETKTTGFEKKPTAETTTTPTAAPVVQTRLPLSPTPQVLPEKNYGFQRSPMGTAELERRESELYNRELKFMAKQLLTEKGLPSSLAEILLLTDESSVVNAVNILAELFGDKENVSTNGFRVLGGDRLPDGENNKMQEGELRRAFGLM